MLRAVATAGSEAEAEMICVRLSNSDIHAIQQRSIGGPQWGGSGARYVYVQEQDAERATALLSAPEFSDEELAELSERAYNEASGDGSSE
jgi:hypothetical protein